MRRLTRLTLSPSPVPALYTPFSTLHTHPSPPPPGPPPAWYDTALPPSLRPYAALARLHDNTGTSLLAYPSLYAIALATPPAHLPDPVLCTLFTVGSVLLRGAGCTVNDLWDQRIDAQVERTRHRPLASGAVSRPQAAAFLVAQLIAGAGILAQLNPMTQAIGVGSLALVGSYPYMKRITYLPQAYLGLTINFGAIMGWTAVRGVLDPAAVALYTSCAAWTVTYDTVYAHQDKKDDAEVGVKSMALLLGQRTREILSGVVALQGAALVAAGFAADLVSGAYFAGVAGICGAQWVGLWRVDLNKPSDCKWFFGGMKVVGAVLLAGIVAGRALQKEGGSGGELKWGDMWTGKGAASEGEGGAKTRLQS